MSEDNNLVDIPEDIENLELEVAEEETLEVEPEAKDEVFEESISPDPLSAYAVSKGWKPDGEKSAEEFLDYAHRKNNNQVKSLEQSMKMLTKKLADKEKKNAESMANEISTMMDKAVETGDTEAYNYYKKKHLEARDYVNQAENEFSIDESAVNQQVLMQDFANRNSALLRDPEAYAFTESYLGTLQKTSTHLSDEEVVRVAEAKLHELYGNPQTKVAQKVGKPTATSRAPSKVTADRLYPEHRTTFQFLKDDFPDYTLKQFVEDMKKENPEFKLRGE